MEHQHVPVGRSTFWVVWNDAGSAFVSVRSLGPFLGYAEASKAKRAFLHAGCTSTNRCDFPLSCRSKEQEETHFFFRLGELLELCGEKHLRKLAGLSAHLGQFAATTAFSYREKLNSLSLSTSRSVRQESGQPLAGPHCVAGSANVEGASTIVRQRRPSSLADVPVPPSQFDNAVPVRPFTLPKHFDGSDSESPFRPSREGPVPLFAQTLRERPVLPEADVDNDEDDLETAGSVGQASHFSLDILDDLHTSVLRHRGLMDQEVPHLSLSRTPGILSVRNYPEISLILETLGHAAEPVGAGSRYGKFSWVMLQGCANYPEAVVRALRHFKKVRTVTFWSRGREEARTWFLESTNMCLDELLQLQTVMFVNECPPRVLPAAYQTPLCQILVDKYSFIASSGTSLGNHAKTPAIPLSGQTSDRCVVVTEEFLHRIALRSPCCQKMLLKIKSHHGFEATIALSCCKHSAASESIRTMPGSVAEANRRAFAALAMCGRPAAVKRFLHDLGIGGQNGIPDRGATQGYWRVLLNAVEPIYQRASRVLLAHLLASDMPLLSIDIAFKRMAKSNSSMGEALSTVVSFCDPRTGKVLMLFIVQRKNLEQRRFDNGGRETSLSPTVPGRAPLLTKLGGAEHPVFELGLQSLLQVFELAKDIIAELDGFADTGVDLDDLRIRQIVVDALSSAPGSIARVFGTNVVEVFIDWWHRRTSAKKAIGKVEKEKGPNKQAKYPRFAGLQALIAASFSECLFAEKEFHEFQAEVEALMHDSGNAIFDLDASHQAAWTTLMADLGVMYSKINVNLGTSVNERFHAHIRFFCLKGDAMSHDHWTVAVMFAFLSFNNIPDWKKDVTENFLKEMANEK